MKTETTLKSSVQTKWCKTIGDCDTAIAELSTPALKKMIAAYKQLKKILPEEGFTMRYDFFIGQAEFLLLKRANEERVARGEKPIWK